MAVIRDFCKKHHISLIAGGVCTILASLFILIFSYSTSPFYGDFFGGYLASHIGYAGDTSQFLTIGRSWSEGQVPYRDIFDHKGPFIFLIDALGYLIGGKVAICIIQIINLAVTFFFVYKISTLATKKWWLQGLTIVLTLLTLVCNFTDGNSVQEYCLPWIMASVYFIVKFLLQKHPRQHNWKIAILYGACFGVCCMTQLTNAILPCAGILVIVIALSKNKQWRNLGQNLLAGLSGFLLVCLPFVIYFAINNAFGDFIFATFVYNFEYASHAQSWLSQFTDAQFITLMASYCSVTYLFPTIFFVFTRKKYYYGTFLSIAAVAEIYLFSSTLLHQHYPMVVLAQVPLFLNELYLVKRNEIARLIVKIIMILIIAWVVWWQIIYYLRAWPTKFKASLDPQPVGYENLIEPYLEDMQNTSVLADGNLPLKDFYLRYNIPVSDKFFTIQGWHANYDPQIKAEIENQFRTTQTKYIITDRLNWFTDLFNDRYEKLGTDNGFSLYRIKP